MSRENFDREQPNARRRPRCSPTLTLGGVQLDFYTHTNHALWCETPREIRAVCDHRHSRHITFFRKKKDERFALNLNEKVQAERLTTNQELL